MNVFADASRRIADRDVPVINFSSIILPYFNRRSKGHAVCGLAGWLGYRHDMRAQAEVVRRMTATMACRGPDETGIWLGRHCALGHRRLAVIDLPGGKQPMTTVTADGSVTLVYSGECYNYTELRAELRS